MSSAVRVPDVQIQNQGLPFSASLILLPRSNIDVILGSKMYQDLKQSFWWTRMKRDVARFVSQCDVCRRVKAQHQKPTGMLQPLEVPKWKWDHIEMDFFTGFPRSQKGNNA